MLERALDIHDPKDKRTHSVLRFFSEDLKENEKIEFIKAIFKRGSWTLAAEISKTSQSERLSEETKNIFIKIIEEWVIERINHSNSKLSEDTRNPYLPKRYSYEFREAIIAIKDLGFHPELMIIIKKFITECYRAYLDKFFDGTFWLAIEDFNSKEIETFFLYFSNLFIENGSDNIGDFLYSFLRSLAYSPQIFFLSDEFLENLNQLSLKIKNSGIENNHSLLISVLLIELIRLKELDLSKAKYKGIISPTINKLERGSLANLELLSFLNKYKYSFEKFNFKSEITSFLNGIEANIIRLKEAEEGAQKAILHHYIKSSDDYLELFVFQLGFIDEDDKIKELKRFVNLIDRLRNSFPKIMWFKEYNNFTPIKGEINQALQDGFGVKLDKCYIDEFLKNEVIERVNKEEFIEDNLLGFSNKKSFRKNSDLNQFYSYLKNNSTKENYISSSTDSVSQVNLFHISSVNYSSSNKGSIINLMPFNEPIYKILRAYNIKSFFSCLDIFLVYEACNFLKVIPPMRFGQYSPILSRLLPSTQKLPLKLDLKEEGFWKVIKEYRPNIYKEIYIKQKRKDKEFKKLLEIYSEDRIINGTILNGTKGGFYVDIEGSIAFLPGSQIELYVIPDYDSYLGKVMDFKIIKVYHEDKSVVVSHKVILEEEIKKQQKTLMLSLKKGKKFNGVVKNITSYGVFVDLGGIDGLIHITDLSWSRITHPDEIVKLNQKIKVVILDFDEDKSKIQLGFKQLLKHPLELLAGNLNVGDEVKCRVKMVKNYGAFVELMNEVEGIEGLIHISELSWKENRSSAKEIISVGEIIRAKVIHLNVKAHRILLSVKQLTPDPWINISSKIRKGEVLKGKITRVIIGVGILIEILPEVEGFIHNSKIRSKKDIGFKEGQEIYVKIISIDFIQRKVKLGLSLKNKKGIKRNSKTNNKRSKIIKKIRIGDVFEGIVVENEKGVGVVKAMGINMDIICPARYMKNIKKQPIKTNSRIKFRLLEKDFRRSRFIVSPVTV